MPIIVDVDKAPVKEFPERGMKRVSIFDPTMGIRNVDLHINILLPGITKGAIHYHAHVEDIYFVLEGTGKIVDAAGTEYQIRAGQAVYFRPGEPPDSHELFNVGDKPLKVIELYAPPHPREFYAGDNSKKDSIVVKNIE